MSAAQKFYSRAPRYILETGENNSMRFAAMGSRGRAYETQVVDISETGLAFDVSSNEAPTYALDEGDMLKIEFTPPGAKPIACFATVVRMDLKETWNPEFGQRFAMRIAVQFRNLPSVHLKALQHSLGQLTSHDALETEYSRAQTILALVIGAGALCAFLYAMSLPASFWHKLF